MATMELPIRTNTYTATDVGAIWQAAIVRYEETASVKIKAIARVNSVSGILEEIKERETTFNRYRHDGSKSDKFRSAVSKSLGPIEKLGNIVSSAASTSFPPSTAIFTAVGSLIKAANSVSTDYDKIAGFFDDLELYLYRLKILENNVSPVPELVVALTEVLASVLVLCGISEKYIKMKRIVKAFRNLASEDSELSDAYAQFHRMVDQEEGAVRYATLASVLQLQKESTAVSTAARKSLAVTERTGLDTKTLLASTERCQKYLESREIELQRHDTLTKLSLLNFHAKQRDTFAKHHEGTGQWLLETGEFQQWFKGKGPSILWCPGIPGAGKTVMTSLAVNYVHESIQGTKAAIAYIYCDYKDPKTQSELGLLASISRQLTEQTNPIPLAVEEFCHDDAEKRRNPTGDEWISLIKSISLLFQTTYILVDAVDECSETNRENFLSLLRKLEPFVRLFMTSRLNLDLRTKFPNVSRITISASVSDVETYLEYEASTNNRLSLIAPNNVSLRNDMVKCVSQMANGMFLLAYLQIDYLCKQRNLKAVREAMKTLPKKVLEFYGKAMERIEDQEQEDSQLARKALSYIFCARRPLKVKELLHVLAVEAEDTELDENAFAPTEILLDISAGLITIDEKSDTVGLVHYTLQEYLEEHREKLLPDPEVEIARACLTYLSFDIFAAGPCSSEEGLHQRLHEYQFLDYAARNWGFHVAEDQLHKKIVNLLLTFLGDEKKLSSFVQILHIAARRTNDWHQYFPKKFGPLHAVAYWGLDKIIIILSESGIEVDIKDSHGTTALQLAAKYGHKPVVQLLLNRGANINTRNRYGETALYWAARNGHKATLKLLLMKGANVLTKDYEGWTALDWVAVGGNHDVLKILLEHGDDVTANNDGRHKALFLAAEEGHELTVRMLLKSGANVNAQDHLGSTALDFAAPSGHGDTMQVLLQNGADVKSRDLYGNTVLHWAVPHEILVQMLLDHGVNIDAKNEKGQTALCWAAQDGPTAVVELLLENSADVNTQDIYGFTALHRATLRGREAVAQLLLDHGANPNLKDMDRWTPLHVATLKRHKGLVQLLLDRVEDGGAILDWMALQLQDNRTQASLGEIAENKAEASTALTGLRETIQERQLGRSQFLLDKGADVNGRDIGGWTALIIAAQEGDEETVQLLLDNGADVNIRGYDERTVLHWACDYGNEAIVPILVNNGADVNASTYGWTAMLLAAKSAYMAIVHFLIQNGADTNAEDYHGRTALHWAVKYDSRSVVQLLVDKGAKANAADRWGRTPLIWAVENMNESLMKLLLQRDADVEVKARHNFTALHLAAFMGSQLAVHHLLKGGANLEAKCKGNFTPLHIAASMGCESVVQLLLDEGADVEAKAQWCGAEDDEESESGTVDMTEESWSGLLHEWFLEQGIHTDGGTEVQRGLTAFQLAARGGHVNVQRLLE